MSLLDGALAFLFAPPAAGGGDVGAQRRNPGESLTRIVYREIRIGLCMTEAYSVLVFTSYLHVTEICRITELLV